MQIINFTENQYNAVIGSLLGDGCISTINGSRSNSKFRKSQKISNKEYILSLFDILVSYNPLIGYWTAKTGYGIGKTCIFLETKKILFLQN